MTPLDKCQMKRFENITIRFKNVCFRKNILLEKNYVFEKKIFFWKKYFFWINNNPKYFATGVQLNLSPWIVTENLSALIFLDYKELTESEHVVASKWYLSENICGGKVADLKVVNHPANSGGLQ